MLWKCPPKRKGMPSRSELPETSRSSRRLLLQYSGMAGKFFLVCALLVLLGYKLDKYLDAGFPVMVWVLPLTGILALLYRAVADTSKKRS